MEDNYFDNNPKKTTFYYLAIVVLFFFSMLSIGVDITEYSQQKDINIPSWFFLIIFIVDFLMIASLVAIFFYRKLGAYIYPIAITAHFFLHEFYLSTLLYSDLFNLFCYFALGLLAIVPKWKFFK